MGISLLTLSLLSSCKNEEPVEQVLKDPQFENVSVHDPSIIKAEESYYILGSHTQFAKSEDLIHWNQLSENVNQTNLFEDIRKELEEEFDYAKTDTLWAGDIQQLKNGKYYMYYCLCQGTSPLSVLGVAVADSIEGPYKKVESFLYSGTSPQFDKTYDATVDPNVIDPHVFYDNDDRLWMVYGSYSGGIYIMEMDGDTGLPIDENSYGTKLLGGNHSRIEAPYILYNSETEYYYLFTSFGGLDSFGGYNMRVARSKSVEGPYIDGSGQEMIEAKGSEGTTFDDVSIENYGNKLMGNFLYEEDDGLTNAGYVSPGHNSAIYNEEQNAYYLIFHTRFPNGGENHEVRVHQFYFTEDGWPIVTPVRYANEKIANYTASMVNGSYRLLEFSKEISDSIVEPKEVTLENGKLSGKITGGWTLSSDNIEKDSIIKINEKEYRGKFISVWDENQEKQVMSYTGVSEEGVPLYLIQSKE
ncbi:endo-alpha-(1-_5)-L-arabinanase [Enterococcus sp. JM4C]|nr:endo-alpha-(1->5)-L-arabinanase [Enterococcus sp. JM4C]